MTRGGRGVVGRWRGVLAAVGAIVAAGVVLFAFDPARSSFYPRCLFHDLTGLHCPGCGATRALHQLLRGRFAAALRLNALLVVSLPFVGGFAAVALRARVAGRPAPWSPLGPAWPWLAVALALAFGIARNLPFPPFLNLAPEGP